MLKGAYRTLKRKMVGQDIFTMDLAGGAETPKAPPLNPPLSLYIWVGTQQRYRFPCDWSDDNSQPIPCIFELVPSKGTGCHVIGQITRWPITATALYIWVGTQQRYWFPCDWSDDHTQPLPCIFELVPSKGTGSHVIGQIIIHSHILVYWSWYPAKVQVPVWLVRWPFTATSLYIEVGTQQRYRLPCDWSDDHSQPLPCIFELVPSKGTGCHVYPLKTEK